MTKLTILGSGTAISPSYSSSYLLQHLGHNYLIECGEGVRHRLAKINVDYFDIEAVFMTHFHPDHFNLETLIQSIMVRNYHEKKEKILEIFGPPETGERLKNIWDNKHNVGHFEKTLPHFLKIIIHEYEDRKMIKYPSLERRALYVTPYFLAHGNMPAVALRFDIDKNIFAYSGDTGVNDEIVEASRGAETFLCECNQKPGAKNPGHLNPSEVGTIAEKSRVKKLVLTHMPGFNTEEELKNDIRKGGYDGEIKIPEDFDVLQLVNV